jgi:hypothetical protein
MFLCRVYCHFIAILSVTVLNVITLNVFILISVTPTLYFETSHNDTVLNVITLYVIILISVTPSLNFETSYNDTQHNNKIRTQHNDTRCGKLLLFVPLFYC